MASTKGKGSMISTQRLQIMVYNEILMVLTKIPSMFFSVMNSSTNHPSFSIPVQGGK